VVVSGFVALFLLHSVFLFQSVKTNDKNPSWSQFACSWYEGFEALGVSWQSKVLGSQWGSCGDCARHRPPHSTEMLGLKGDGELGIGGDGGCELQTHTLLNFVGVYI
jgi:hypothetical protein